MASPASWAAPLLDDEDDASADRHQIYELILAGVLGGGIFWTTALFWQKMP